MVFWAEMGSMFLLGLVSTGHCIGMCGPLVLALPGGPRTFRNHVAYHLGRITTYSVVGALAAGIGAGLRYLAAGGDEDPLGTVERLQVVISIFSALLLLVLGIARLGLIKEPAMLSIANPAGLPGFRAIQARAARGSVLPIFALGLLLGLLPCGLSYAAFARVLPSESLAQGAMLVAAFGLGTVPGLLLLGTAAAALFRKHRRLTDLLAGILLVAMALSIGVDAALGLFSVTGTESCH